MAHGAAGKGGGVSAHLRYLSYVLRHKWFVLVAGLRVGAPLWRLLIHDWSKLTPAEWFPYVRKFYGKVESDESRARTLRIASVAIGRTQAEIDEAFDRAWLHHQHANPHHWQHWVLREDGGATLPLPMPGGLAREMVADWLGAGRAITGRWEAGDWYAKNRSNMVLHPDTREYVERLIAEHATRENRPSAIGHRDHYQIPELTTSSARNAESQNMNAKSHDEYTRAPESREPKT